MEPAGEASVGRVVALWRYPVKSMMGEELNAATVTPRGVLGDRGYALIDGETQKVGSAKNPKRWPGLFDFRAVYVEPPEDADSLPAARITLPDGSMTASDGPDVDAVLSQAIGRPVRLASAPPQGLTSEGYVPEVEGIPDPDTVFEFELPAGTFFDGAPLHVVTTASLDRLQRISPGSRFEVRRFRPNVVVALEAEEQEGEGFVEDGWVGRTVRIGAEVRVAIWRPTPRCVMTTLPQGELPRDPGILRAAARENRANVGVYATVVHGGRVVRGDAVVVE
jgi:uncharacterized protein YcbX